MNRYIDMASVLFGAILCVFAQDLGTNVALLYAIGGIFIIQIYLLPVRVAEWRNHRNVLPIAILVFLGGWTIIFWFVGLIWAVYVTKEQEKALDTQI